MTAVQTRSRVLRSVGQSVSTGIGIVYTRLSARVAMVSSDESEDPNEALELISNRINAILARRPNLSDSVTSVLRNELSKAGITADIQWRMVSPLAALTQMQTHSIAFEQLNNIFECKVILSNIVQCYQALGIIHTRWPAIPGRLKDNISTPTGEGYTSLDTVVLGPGSQRIQFKIRTIEMHRKTATTTFCLRSLAF